VRPSHMGQAVTMSPASDPASDPASAHVAFICAMPMELEPLIRKLDLHESKVGDVTVHRGTLGGRPVVAIVTGMGTDFASEGTTRLLDAVEVGHVVVVGITGAVENETPIGTLILPEVVVNSATGAEYRPAPLGDGQAAGAMWTTDTLITDLDEVARLRTRGVVSLDMETAAIAALCEQRGIPWSVFRVISDRATDGSLDEEVFRLSNLDGTPNNEAIERYFAEHPERIEVMARLADGALLAAETAADAAIRACGSA
jgi:adenosylhomocysteine nucleosidase